VVEAVVAEAVVAEAVVVGEVVVVVDEVEAKEEAVIVIVDSLSLTLISILKKTLDSTQSKK
jgi:hypothetical protein